MVGPLFQPAAAGSKEESGQTTTLARCSEVSLRLYPRQRSLNEVVADFQHSSCGSGGMSPGPARCQGYQKKGSGGARFVFICPLWNLERLRNLQRPLLASWYYTRVLGYGCTCTGVLRYRWSWMRSRRGSERLSKAVWNVNLEIESLETVCGLAEEVTS